MKISLAKPPCFKEANELFKLEELNMGTVFTYGDTLYNPWAIQIPDHLVAHEEVHARQQHHDDLAAKLWWDEYIKNPQFRLEQEAEAYAVQYAFICKTVKDPNSRAKNLWGLATHLSGPMYGRIVTHREAMALIKSGGKINKEPKHHDGAPRETSTVIESRQELQPVSSPVSDTSK